MDEILYCYRALYSFRYMDAKLVASFGIDPYSRFVSHPDNSMERMEEIQKSAGKNTPFSFPLVQNTFPIINTKSYFDWPQWDYKRLKGFGNVKRNDIVVFNFPAGDTIALKMQKTDYYTLVQQYGRSEVWNNKNTFGDIIYRPVDKKENYVKRCIGLPGNTGWTRDNYGPIWIPKKGATIKLTPENVALYKRCIVNYERNTLKEENEKYYINDKPKTTYTFKYNYFWMMGDNRHNSADSRSWGFVPEDHVVGKPMAIWLSIDKDRNWFDGHIRWNRLFNWVKNID